VEVALFFVVGPAQLQWVAKVTAASLYAGAWCRAVKDFTPPFSCELTVQRRAREQSVHKRHFFTFALLQTHFHNTTQNQHLSSPSFRSTKGRSETPKSNTKTIMAE
jgi:hypothetical protein